MTGGQEQGQLGGYCNNPGRSSQYLGSEWWQEGWWRVVEFVIFVEGRVGRIASRSVVVAGGKREKEESSQIKCDIKTFDLSNSWMESPHTDYQNTWGWEEGYQKLTFGPVFKPFDLSQSEKWKKKNHILICISLTMRESDHLRFLYCDPFILII